MKAWLIASAPAAIVLVIACGGAREPDPAQVATLPASSAASAVPSGPVRAAPDMSNPAAWEGHAWTDDAAARALAKDSRWDPGGCFESLRESAGKSTDGITPERPECMPLLAMACAQVPGQTCVPDECSQSDYDCVPACNGECTNCGVKCADSCDACKTKCTDDDCRLACGKTCGACRQGCLKELDHCTSAHCSEVSEQCFASRDDEWNASKCETVCPRVASCVEKCPEIENDWSGQRFVSPCAESCMTRFGKGCPKRFDRICAGDPNASVNFNVYHSTRKDAGK